MPLNAAAHHANRRAPALTAMRRAALPALLAAGLWLAAGPAAAHAFKVGFLVPAPNAEADHGRDALDAFRLAARERDGHPGETADGHLGGLDVYLLPVQIRPIDADPGAAAALARVEALATVERVEFVTGLLPHDLIAPLGRRLAGTATVLIVPDPLPARDAVTMDGVLFYTAFSEATGRAPGPAAYTGYALARLLDRAVRALDGDFTDRAALDAALKAGRAP